MFLELFDEHALGFKVSIVLKSEIWRNLIAQCSFVACLFSNPVSSEVSSSPTKHIILKLPGSQN